MLEPGLWQLAHIALVRSVAAALAPTSVPANTLCEASQSDPALLAWQDRQASLLGRVFQLSPCGVRGLSPEWHFVQLRRSCGKPTSEKFDSSLPKPQIVKSSPPLPVSSAFF